MLQKDIDKIIEGLTPNLQSVIIKTVNGKIDKMDKKLDEYISQDTNDKQKLFDWQTNWDKTWKEDYAPTVRGLVNATGGAKIAVWIALGITAISGAYLAIKKLLL